MRKRSRGRAATPLLTVPLDPILWDALQDIAAQQARSVQNLVMEIARDSLVVAIHVYIAEFYRETAGPSSDG